MYSVNLLQNMKHGFGGRAKLDDSVGEFTHNARSFMLVNHFTFHLIVVVLIYCVIAN